jgi:translocation and assembly module TamB
VDKEKSETAKPSPSLRKWIFRLLKWMGWLILGIIVLFIAVVLLIRTPKVQQWITDKATAWVEDQTGASCSVDRLYLTFSGNLWLEGVYLSDLEGDTLFYSRTIETGVRILPLFDNEIRVRKFSWSGLTSGIKRDSSGVYNYDFLTETFGGESEVPGEETPDPVSWNIILSPIHISDFAFSLHDHYEGLHINSALHLLEIEIGPLATLEPKPEIYSIVIEGLDVFMENSVGAKPKLEEPDDGYEEDSPGGGLIPIVLKHINLRDISLHFIDGPGDSELNVDLVDFSLQELILDPAKSAEEVNKLAIQTAEIIGLQVHQQTFGTAVDRELKKLDAETVGDEEVTFEWPDWEVEIGQFSISDSKFILRDHRTAATPGQFNADDLNLSVEKLDFNQLSLKDRELSVQITEMIASEANSFEVRDFGLDVFFSEQFLTLDEFRIRTAHSYSSATARVEYKGVNQLINQPLESVFNLDLGQTEIGPRDILALQPKLAEDSLIGPFLEDPARIRAVVSGTVHRLNIENLVADVGTSTRLGLRGQVRNLTETENITYALSHFHLYSTERDLVKVIPPDTTYRIPENMLVAGTLSGSYNHIGFDLGATIPKGNFSIGGQIGDLQGEPNYRIDLSIDALDAAYYTDSLGPEAIVGNILLIGQGFDPESMFAELKADFSTLIYKGQSLSPLNIAGTYTDKEANAEVYLGTEMLDFTILANGSFDTTYYTFDADLHLRNLDLRGMELHEDSIYLSTILKASGSGNTGLLDANFRFDSLLVRKNSENYWIDSLYALVILDSNTTFVDLKSSILEAELSANTSAEKIAGGLMAHINSYLDPEFGDSLLIEGLEADFHLRIAETEFLREVIAPDLESMEEIRLSVRYREVSRSILADLDAPYVNYMGYEIFGTHLKAESNRDSLEFTTGFSNLASGAINVQQTLLSGTFRDSLLRATFDMSSDTLDQIALMNFQLSAFRDTFKFHLEPGELVFNNENWGIAPNNSISYATEYLRIEEFKLQRRDNLFEISSHPSGSRDFLRLDFDNLSLNGLLDLINPEEEYADGIMTGFIEVDDIFEDPRINLKLDVVDLMAMDIPLGNLQATVENLRKDEYDLFAELGGGEIDLHLKGVLDLRSEDEPEYRGDIVLNSLEFSMLEQFTEGAIRNSHGKLRGEVKSSGSGTDIEYSGFILFDSIGFVVTETSSAFRIPQERIDFSQSEIQFLNFTIRDGANNPTVVNGGVDITNLTNPTFDLNINSRDFHFLESTRQDNDFFFGKALADLDVDVMGNLNRPRVSAVLNLKRGTDVTMIVPESQIAIEEREGIVRIESRVDGKVVRDEEEEETPEPLFTGVDLDAVIRIDPNVVFRIVLDERSGDQLEVAGRADLSFDMDAEGRMALSGTYELTRGFYEMRMYDIVRRRFELKPGSRLIWSGDPMEADMQITAVYNLRTSALDLMADQLAGADQATRTQYRQELPFEVLLDISGELLRPNLSFSLDMPEGSRGALGGNVYSRIQQLNTTESELNTQVFSLLVLNRFLPQGVASEESRGFDAGAMARSSASSILSGQLNALSDRYVRGVDLDFDLESFTDYQTGRPEDRTQLNVRMRRSLVGERLTIEVGGQIDLEGSDNMEGQSATDILGDVNIEYRLTEDGTWRLRGFRRNQYEGVMEGQVIATGVSLLFNRDFNSFAELFSRNKDPED